jgi:phosphatidate cytidylyltransferase
LQEIQVDGGVQIIMDVWVSDSKIADRLLYVSKGNSIINGAKASTQHQTLISEKNNGDKLLEAVSPKKTWEGLFGGMASAVISGYFLYSLMPESFSRIEWIAIASIVALFANIGDLIESQIKRIKGVKDSGKLLPGHGGVLDRFDGLLIALPLVIIYLILF